MKQNFILGATYGWQPGFGKGGLRVTLSPHPHPAVPTPFVRSKEVLIGQEHNLRELSTEIRKI